MKQRPTLAAYIAIKYTESARRVSSDHQLLAIGLEIDLIPPRGPKICVRRGRVDLDIRIAVVKLIRQD